MDFRFKFALFVLAYPLITALALILSISMGAREYQGFVIDEEALVGDLPENDPERKALLLEAIRELILEKYAGRVDPKKLSLDSLEGIIESLEYSEIYYHNSQKGASQFHNELDGKEVGIGLSVHRPDRGDGRLLVKHVLYGSPADFYLSPGDEILEMQGIPAEELTPKRVNELSRGDGVVGSICRLKVLKKGENKAHELTLPREVLRKQSVYGERVLDEKYGIGYIRIEEFLNPTHDEFLNRLYCIMRRNISSLIIDLRFNKGGILDGALEIANLFIRQGVLVTTEGRTLDSCKEYRAKRNRCRFPNLRLAVLINEKTTSAAEILAGTLRDHGRAVLIGKRSFGKGAVQSAFPCRIFGGAVTLKFPTAYYYLPKGRCIEGRLLKGSRGRGGLEPDIEVRSNLKPEELKDRFDNMKFFSLKEKEDNPVRDLYLRDSQLEAAIRHLRGSKKRNNH